MGNRQRGLTFGSVAEDYERYRPGYPGEVAAQVLAYASEPTRTAVEIGAGTGKATRGFASLGIAVTAVEPDAGMLTVLRRESADLDVTPVQATLETFATSGQFDLLYSAAAWHWTDPATRWPRTVALVRPGGTVAFFGSPTRVDDPDLAEAVAAAQRAVVPDDDVHPDGEREPRGELRWPGTELEASGMFTDVTQRRIPGKDTVSRDDFLHELSTVSAYLVLTPEARVDVLRRIAAVLPARVPLDRTVTLHLARTKESR